jgi:hypothetical protein
MEFKESGGFGSAMKASAQQRGITAVLKTYRIFKKMNQYPNLLALMRSILMDVLEKKGISTPEQLYEQAQEEMKGDGVPDTETNRQEYLEGLIDYYSANYLTPSEIENPEATGEAGREGGRHGSRP